MFNNNLFCERLKSLRLKKNLTLEQFGTYFKVTKQTTSRWETGDRIPSLEMLCLICDFYNVSIDYLVGRTNNPKVNNELIVPISDNTMK